MEMCSEATTVHSIRFVVDVGSMMEGPDIDVVNEVCHAQI